MPTTKNLIPKIPTSRFSAKQPNIRRAKKNTYPLNTTQRKTNGQSQNFSELIGNQIPTKMYLELFKYYDGITENDNIYDIALNCALYLKTHFEDTYNQLKFDHNKDDIVYILGTIIEKLNQQQIKIATNKTEIVFYKDMGFDFCGHFIFFDYVDKIKNPILKKAYANLVLDLSKYLISSFEINTPIENPENHDDNFHLEYLIENIIEENTTENSQQLFKELNNTINHFNATAKQLQDANWYNELLNYKPKTNDDDVLKHAIIQTGFQGAKVLFHFNDNLRDFDIHGFSYKESFRVLFIGNEFPVEQTMLQSMDDSFNNDEMRGLYHCQTYNLKTTKLVFETSKKEIKKIKKLGKAIDTLGETLYNQYLKN